ncbi:Riboflavin transporter [Pseudidiomarina piscicola]|uniref:Riboflavin transporter n=1 Tax=Pseudidiomarina piscicola TaxID=2614830 RepID=A0A6S6WUC3_9GAMM|nr:DMT family transporter [Pseudidiomarina piscicola]CAB0150755.1 Riboflavin transporter [Pseudidiomarina piscicola]VZT40260.1 Riboflavin transporter [Pseudomonas aeruginosa]
MDRTVIQAVVMLIFGNNVAILSDSMIKLLGSHDAPFMFAFMRQLSALVLLLPFMLWLRKPLKPSQLRWHMVRSHIWLIGSLCMVLSLTTLPLATANAVFYAAPLLTVILAVLFFRERVSFLALMASVLGLCGVLVIVNPGEVNGFVVAALVVAFSLAVNNLLIKKLPAHHGVLETLFYTSVFALPLGAIGALLEGASWNWQMLGLALGSSVFVLVYAATCVFAYRAAQSNVVSSAEYTGLVGAVVVGIIFFAEQPEMRFYIGATLIIVPLVLLTTLQRERPA